MKFDSRFLYACVITATVLIVTDGHPQDEDDPSLRTIRFHASSSSAEPPCQYRRQEGVCRRRSECRRPTRRICSYGFNPVVCCMDPVIPETTKATPPPPPPKTTKRAVAVTAKPVPRPAADIKEVDILFPGCGSRSPAGPAVARDERNEQPRGRNRGGLFSRLGKRETPSDDRRIPSRVSRQIKPVIVGGTTAVANSWPWMGAIFKQAVAGGPTRFLCGASLISRRYILSAAHCFDGEKGNIDPSKFSVMVGSHTTKDGTTYPVERILVHPEYQTLQYYNDMSLLRLRRDVALGKKVYPVCLPSESLKNQIRTGENNVTVTGWGDSSFGGVSSKLLQEVNFPIIPLKQCNASYAKVAAANFPRGITNLFICAGLKEGGKDACQGDSGGPMVMKLASNTWVQLGIVSFGYGCAQAGYPGVYTRVSRFTQWLYDNTDLG